MSSLEHFIKIDPYYLELGYKRQHAMLLTYLNNWQSWWQKQNPNKVFEGIYLSVDKIAYDLRYSTRSIYRWIDDLNDDAIEVFTEVRQITGGFAKRMKLALNPRLAKVRQSVKDVCQSVKDVCQSVNPSIYKNNQEKKSLKHTDPDARAEADFESLDLDPEIDRDSLVNTKPITPPLVVASISGKQEISESKYITGHQTSIESFDRQMRSPASGDEELGTEMVALYNNGKPEYWGECRQLNSVIRGQIKQLRSRYGSDDELLEDWKAAILSYKASDFHNSPKFQSGGIYFLLAPNQPDRVKIAAEKWRSSSDAAKTKLVQKIVEQQNGIPEWGTQRIISGIELGFYRRLMERRFVNNPNDRPNLEYYQTYFPEILEKYAN
jgi:hypothetical protein